MILNRLLLSQGAGGSPHKLAIMRFGPFIIVCCYNHVSAKLGTTQASGLAFVCISAINLLAAGLIIVVLMNDGLCEDFGGVL